MSADAARIQELNDTADDLAVKVGELTEAVDRQSRRLRWTRVLVALNLGLSVGFGWMFHQNAVLRAQVLCPLYSVLANSYNPRGPSAKALGPEAYNQNFAQIQIQYQALDCSPPPTALPIN
ncbi:MAG TPA: hypothetical protein VIQ30_23045 [Pseudonocardia sp.]